MAWSILIFGILCIGLLVVWPRRVLVNRVVDGDSLEGQYRANYQRIRIKGFDAPEYNQNSGREARAKLAEITQAHIIRIVMPRNDCYGRILGTCYAGLWPVSWRMIVAGYGWPDTKIGFILSLYPRLRNLGLWSHPHRMHPSKWRKMSFPKYPGDF